MQIIEQTETGAPEVLRLRETETPVPGPAELRIRVAAAGVNPVDAFVRAGAVPMLGAPPFRIGWDVAGYVTAKGDEVRGIALGDRVMGLLRFPAQAGAYAEEVLAPAAEIAHVPDRMDDLQAGALPLAGLTAWQALMRHGHLRPGQKVLIHAAAGGVGHIAVQIAKAFGAEVWATASAGKHAAVRALGADHLIDYRTEDFTDHGPFDLILDHAGGAHVLRSLDALRPGGHVTTLLEPAPEAVARAEAAGKSLVRMIVTPDRAGLVSLGELAAEGKLDVLVAQRFALADAAKAHHALESRPVGKIVLTP
ncbi:NADP-dependent oxidoreductase [Salipiger sp. P9]|uniref:quinone oxidoreductase family protein n=1 Tax=Salipiger pentaromativorans TaxID=2943193 RepID=UPI002157B3CC|nr:NADP-dependent oxidoreductase [Salipiger pentaromativorans]MCR8550704.1 NADP-dependent oxidoreductase [Salipiger pentaromativorans]